MISTYEVWFLPLCHPVQWGQNVERTVLRVTTAVTNYIAQSITDWKKKSIRQPAGRTLCSMFYNSAGGSCYNTLHIPPNSALVNTIWFHNGSSHCVRYGGQRRHSYTLGDGVTLFGESVDMNGARLLPLRWQRIVGKFWEPNWRFY
jgi:hypothetical protein